MKLDLGCGSSCSKDYVGVDIRPFPGVEVVTDLSKRWPFDDNSIEAIKASHIVEHLPDPLFTMSEAYRVLKPGCLIEIDVPSSNGMGAFQDPTHKSFWNINSFLYYDRNMPLGSMYSCNLWTVETVFEYNQRDIALFGPFVKAILRKP
jgi:ubiquinone/menaquinone biosynthesis C-methylase UbiE